MPANLKTSAVATGLEKVSFHSNPREKQCQIILKLPHNCIHLTCKQSNAQNSPSQASTVHEPWTSNIQVGFRKGRGTRDQIVNLLGHHKKQENSRNTSILALLTMPKLLTVWITKNCGQIWKRWEYHTPDLPLEKSVHRSGSNSLNHTWNSRLVPNWERSTSKLYIVILLI